MIRYYKIGLIILLTLFTCSQLLAQSDMDSLEALLPFKTGEEKARLLNEISRACWGISSQRTIDYGIEALQLSDEIGFREGQATALKNIGVGYSNVSENDKALEYYGKALEIYAEIDHKEGVANILNNIGIIYAGYDDYDKALEYYLKSNKIYDEIGDTSGIATSLLNTGAIYDYMRNDKKALEKYEASLKFFRALGDSLGAAMCLNNIGNIYSDMKEYDKALQFYGECLKLNQTIGDKFGIGDAILNIGYAYSDLGDYDRALEYYQKALIIQQELNDKYGMAITLNNIGSLYRKLEKYDESRKYLDRSLQYAEEIKSKDMLKENYDCLAKLSCDEGDYQAAFEFYKMYSAIKDTIFNEKSSKQIAEMQTKYNTEKKEKENELLRKEAQIQQASINRHKIITLFIGLGLCLVLIVALVMIRAYEQKKKANAMLREQKIKIEAQADDLRKANDRLVELDRFKEGMTGMIVHDLKNPLNAIINYSQDKNDLTQVIINQAGKQMHNLVMNILDVQKFEDARMHLEEEDQNLSQLTRNAIDQVELLSREKDLEIINNCASDITVAVDPGIIERVFINLLTNAIKFSPLNGKITIDAADCPVDLIAVAVTDQGKGIPPDKIDSVFDRFEQVSPQKAGKIRSTGLGLTFCKLAIESHGGTIGVESVIGEHTTFWFTLKKSDKASASREPEKEAQRARLNLTEEQRKQLVSTIGQFESIEIYEISALRKILRDISFEDDDELNRWKELVRRAIYSGNEERYRELINI